jgi:hypothetical protein
MPRATKRPATARAKRGRGRPPLPAGARVRDRGQLNVRLDAEVLAQFKALLTETGMSAAELLAALLDLARVYGVGTV